MMVFVKKTNRGAATRTVMDQQIFDRTAGSWNGVCCLENDVRYSLVAVSSSLLVPDCADEVCCCRDKEGVVETKRDLAVEEASEQL